MRRRGKRGQARRGARRRTRRGRKMKMGRRRRGVRGKRWGRRMRMTWSLIKKRSRAPCLASRSVLLRVAGMFFSNRAVWCWHHHENQFALNHMQHILRSFGAMNLFGDHQSNFNHKQHLPRSFSVMNLFGDYQTCFWHLTILECAAYGAEKPDSRDVGNTARLRGGEQGRSCLT